MKSVLGILEWGDNIKNKCYWKHKPASPLVSANVLFGEFEKKSSISKKMFGNYSTDYNTVSLPVEILRKSRNSTHCTNENKMK